MLAPLVLVAALLQAAAPPITVSAAISLTTALEEVATAYRAAGGGPVVFNFAGSNVLARQIVNGAPVDVFVSADDAQMDVVDRAGLIAPGSRAVVAGNRLVLVVGRQSPVRAVRELLGANVRRIAVGDPAAVPAGVYARQYLERSGLWSQLVSKIVPTANVRAALTAVQNGAVDAAFVYGTDAQIGSGVVVADLLAGPDAPTIVYPGCVLTAARQPEAATRFFEFLRGPAGRGILQKHGFSAGTGRR